MYTQRSICLGICLVSLVTLAVSVVALGTRIADYQQDNPTPIYFFRGIGDPVFPFPLAQPGEEPVTAEITWQLSEDDTGFATLRYQGENAEIPIKVPAMLEIDGLDRFEDTLKAFYFAETNGRDFDRFINDVQSGATDLRCVVVARVPDQSLVEGGRFDFEIDEQDWGWNESRRNLWRFDFFELLPEGAIARSSFRFPESGRAFYRRQVRAYQQGEPAPERADDELREGTWQYDAALRLMPRPPAITHERQALLAAGWTLPAASVSCLGVILGAAFFFAPSKRTSPKPESA